MDTFGDLEELLVALDHYPAGVDAGHREVAEQEVQHLGDHPLLGRVHVP